MRTCYILDTSVLIADPSAYLKYKHSDVIFPIMILAELDKLKKFADETGKNARVAIRLLDQLTENVQDISQGIMIEEQDICIKFDTSFRDTDKDSEFAGFGDPNYGDTQILICSKRYYDNHPDHDVILVTQDINLRIKAKSRGIPSIAHNADNISAVNDIYSGFQIIEDKEAAMELLENNFIDAGTLGLDLYENEFVQFANSKGSSLCLGRKVGDKIKIVKKSYPWGLAAKNAGQSCLIDLITDPNIDLISCIGEAGTGKSLCAIAAAMELVFNKKAYEKLIIYRSVEAVGGQDIGFLPGLLEEKLMPWFQATIDSLENLLSSSKRSQFKNEVEMFIKKGQLEFGAIAYLRGRSIPNSIILVDEAQNLNKETIKTLLTRGSDHTKIILLGDILQIDNKNLDPISNGLTYALEKFKNADCDFFGHITLTQGERSRLATKAAEIL